MRPASAEKIIAPQKIVAIDWSGRIDAAGQRRHIWAAVWTPRGVHLESGRTREQWTDWLLAEAAKTPRLVAGIDCCFSYPAWFLAELGCASVFEFWEKVSTGLGEQWLAPAANRHDTSHDPRFWGKPHKKPAEFSGINMPRMMRRTDMLNKISADLPPARAALVRGITPKSPFQIGGAGSVGTASLRGIPMLLRLHRAGWRIWPFQSAAPARPLMVEIYARLLTGPVKKSSAEARREYLTRKRKSDATYRALSRTVLRQATASEDAFDALICAVEMAAHRAEFPRLRATRSPILRLESITWVPGIWLRADKL